MVDVQDIYRGILKPGAGGIYKPGPPVMLPPQGMDGAAITRALVATDPIGDGTSWNQFDDQMNDQSYPVRTVDQIRGIVPGPSGTTFADKSLDRLQPSPAANAFAYGAPSPTAPSLGAISAATQQRDPFVPLHGLVPSLWGWDPVHTDANGMPVDSSTPLNLSDYPEVVAAARAAPQVAPAIDPIVAALAQQAALKKAATNASLQNPVAAAAMAQGQTSYTNPNKSKNGVLAAGARMPTVSISGTPRNTYGD